MCQLVYVVDMNVILYRELSCKCLIIAVVKRGKKDRYEDKINYWMSNEMASRGRGVGTQKVMAELNSGHGGTPKNP